MDMKQFKVTQGQVYELMYQSMRMASISLPSDVEQAFQSAIESERNELARLSLETIFRNCRIGEENDQPLCSDTGFPLFYVRLGDDVSIEGGASALYAEGRKAVVQLTAENILRPNMSNPFTGKNTGNNLGYYFPVVEVKFDPEIDFLEVIAIPKGGGSEIFGTFYRMLYPADGRKGIIKFVVDCIRESTYAGKSCPPNIFGIGVGGTSDLCMKLAKEAAVLRPIGSRHPDPDVADLENELTEMVRKIGVGPMGLGGPAGVFDVHIEYAVTHTSALPVAFNAQCSICRRKTARISPDNAITYHDFPVWEYR